MAGVSQKQEAEMTVTTIKIEICVVDVGKFPATARVVVAWQRTYVGDPIT